MHGIASAQALAWRLTLRVHSGAGAYEARGRCAVSIAAVALCLALGACTATPTYDVTAPGKSDAQIQAEAGSCSKSVIGQTDRPARFMQCMRNFGDTVQPKQNAYAPPSTDPGSRLDGPPAFQAEWHINRAAGVAEKAKDYSEVMRLWRQIDALPEVDVAFAGVPLTGPYTDAFRYYHIGTTVLVDDYADSLAETRRQIAGYYQNGYGVPQDYAEAARWYQKSINTRTIRGSNERLPQARSEASLGLLYVYGLGVPRDRATGRQLLVESGTDHTYLLRLLDNNALPRTMPGNPRFAEEMHAAIEAMNQRDARNRQEEEQAKARAWLAIAAILMQGSSPPKSNMTIPGPSISACNKFTTGSFVSGALGNPWCD